MAQGTYLAVEVSGAGRHPAAWRRPDARPEELLTAARHVELVRLAAAADFVVVPDSLVPPSADPDLLPLRLDAVAIAARVAPVVPEVGLVPAVTVTHTEPFHISKAIATLDLVSSGRAGWEPVVSSTRAEAELFGRKPAAPAAELWREAADVVEVVMRLWDSWEDDVVIRDVATGRYIDRDKLHYIDFTGEFFAVKGPSITPRSPQAHPLVVLRADEPEALQVASARADVVRVAAADLAAAHTARERVRAAVAAGRNPDDVPVLLDVEVLLDSDTASARRALDELDAHRELAASSLRVIDTADALVDVIAEAVSGGAADGVTAVPLALPSGVAAIAADVVPRLVARGLRTPVRPGATLRDRFGLPRPANRYVEANA